MGRVYGRRIFILGLKLNISSPSDTLFCPTNQSNISTFRFLLNETKNRTSSSKLSSCNQGCLQFFEKNKTETINGESKPAADYFVNQSSSPFLNGTLSNNWDKHVWQINDVDQVHWPHPQVCVPVSQFTELWLEAPTVFLNSFPLWSQRKLDLLTCDQHRTVCTLMKTAKSPTFVRNIMICVMIWFI